MQKVAFCVKGGKTKRTLNQISSIMAYLDIMKAGNSITAKHPTNSNYTPTTFYIKGGKVHYYNIEIGCGEHPTLQTEQALTEHFNNLLQEGFILVIQRA